jgi:uncharacterized membrane protein YgcG
VTLQEQESTQSDDRDIRDTEVIVVPAPSPVFVDTTGRRRRLLRRLSYAFGAVCMLYGGLVSVTLAGGPVSTSAILPLPDLGDAAAARPSPTPLSPLGSPKARAIIEALPRRDLVAAETDRFVANRRAATPSPRASSKPATPKPSTTTSRPVESTPTPKPSATPSATSSATPSTSPSTGPTKTKQPPPAPPTSGTGGRSESGGADSSGDGGADSSGDGGASALPAPPTQTPTTDTTDTTPSPTPQPSAAETPA